MAQSFSDQVRRALNTPAGRRLSEEDQFVVSEAAQYASRIGDMPAREQKLARILLQPRKLPVRNKKVRKRR